MIEDDPIDDANVKSLVQKYRQLEFAGMDGQTVALTSLRDEINQARAKLFERASSRSLSEGGEEEAQGEGEDDGEHL